MARKRSPHYFRHYFSILAAVVVAVLILFVGLVWFTPLPTEVFCPPRDNHVKVIDSRGEEFHTFYVQCAEETLRKSDLSPHFIAIFETFNRAGKGDRDLELDFPRLKEHVKNSYLAYRESLKEKEYSLSETFSDSFLLPLKLQVLPQDDLMMRYLNSAYFGRHLYGLSAASHHYFQKNPRDLTFHESLFLISVMIDPSQYDPIINPDSLQNAQKSLLDFLVRKGTVNESEAQDFEQGLLVRIATSDEFLLSYINSFYPQLDQMMDPFAAYKGSYEVQTFIDSELYKSLAELNDGSLKFSLMVLDTKKGHILSMLGTDLRQIFKYYPPRSLMLPFVYLVGIQEGLVPGSFTLDSNVDVLQASGLSYLPFENENSGSGKYVSLREAFLKRLPIPAIKVLQLTPHKRFIALVKGLGLPVSFNYREKYKLGETLQEGKATLFQLAQAFSVLANEGRRVSFYWGDGFKKSGDLWLNFDIKDSLNEFTANPLFSVNFGQIVPKENAYLIRDLVQDYSVSELGSRPEGEILVKELLYDSSGPLTAYFAFSPERLVMFGVRGREIKKGEEMFSKIRARVFLDSNDSRKFERPSVVSRKNFCLKDLCDEGDKVCDVPNRCVEDYYLNDRLYIAELKSQLTQIYNRSPLKSTTLIADDIFFEDFVVDPRDSEEARKIYFYSHEEVVWFLDGEIIGKGKKVGWDPTLGQHVLVAQLGEEFDSFEFEVIEKEIDPFEGLSTE